MDKRNVLLANLMVGNVKLHNLHWNVKGMGFKSTHEYLEGLYDQVFEWYDAVAESMKMEGCFPHASVKKYMEASTVKELDDKDWTEKEAIELAKEYYEELKALVKEIRAEEDEKGNFVSVAMYEDMVSEMDKAIWFMTQMLK